MNTISILKKVLLVGIVLLAPAAAQSNPPFEVKSVQSLVDSGIMLTWNSEAGAVYEIQFSENLAVGSWQTLYSDMPSMGISTFWTDAGDYTANPEVPRPDQVPRRFYRIFKVSQNPAIGPVLTIDNLTPNQVLSGEVTVTVTGVDPDGVAEIRLFVDGAEYDRGDNPGEFIINTTEWKNGPHRISASAVDAAGVEFETTPSVGAIEPNHSATAGLVVSFQNYVSHYRFSEDLFDPEAGETQVITANFEKNSTWTLEIRNEDDVVVRTVTGSGKTMSFAWDGNGDAGANLPQGSYPITIFAVEIVANGLRNPPSSGSVPAQRKVARKVKGVPGTVGVAWQGHHPAAQVPPNVTFTKPASGLPIRPLIDLRPNYSLPYGKLLRAGDIANGFVSEMKKGGWKKGFALGDDALTANALRGTSSGGNSKFNTVNIGLLVGHGIHGESPDFIATNTGALGTYFPIYKTGDTNYDWVRLSQCDFGSANLRWMGIYSCNMLHEMSYDSMYTKGVLPINDKLHLLLGAKTSVFLYESFGKKWASFMLGREDGTFKSVRDSWYLAGEKIMGEVGGPNQVILRVAGWPECAGDKLNSYTTPTSTNVFDIEFLDRQVWPP